jgi:Major capsid protein Gp23
MTQLTVQALLEKWAPVLDADGVDPIADRQRRETTAVLLENTELDIKQTRQMVMEASPVTGTNGYSNGAGGDGLAKYDPVLISMVRRSAPQMIAYDICGVQPLRQPTGLIFALRSKYATMGGTEALFNEANTAFSGAATPVHAGTDPTQDFVDQDAGTVGDQFGTQTTGVGMTTTFGESLGGGVNEFGEMSFSVEQMTVTAKTRALKAGYTTEFAQDLKNLHGLDADAELSNILSTEILGEVNREVLRTIYSCARIGAQDATKAGVFDLLTDSDGRWLAERHKGLLFQIEREANRIAQETRRGKGNILVCSSDVASALAMAGVLDYAPALQSNMNVDESSATFAGILNKRYKVYVDPYSGAAGTQNQFFMVGYKGASAWDAGLFYAPYVPLQIVKTTDPATFTPRMAYRMRYGICRHPFFNGAGRTNAYYRISSVKNII